MQACRLNEKECFAPVGIGVGCLVLACLLTPNVTLGRVVHVYRPPPSTTPATHPATAPTSAPADALQWLTSLDQGYKDAARHERPMLVIYGAQWCGPCRMLQKEMERAQVRTQLTAWTLVHLDVDHPEPGAAPFEGSIPFLKLFTPAGNPIASRVGYMSGEELMRWLAESVPKAVVVDPDLAGTGPPDAETTARLIDKLTSSDAGAREAVIRRLAPWPQLAARSVTEGFANPKAKLRTRLAALDLLQEWKAPVAGLDPWQPETFNTARLDALLKWSVAVKSSATRPADVAVNLQSAEEEIAALLRAADPVEANIISTRLARVGPALLPTVTLRLKDAASDHDRERLTALRYRLVASARLALNWPGGIERLASTDASTRHAAAEELSKRAAADDGPLLLELFSDPDPLVREISLHGLEAVGGKEGTATLVKLLHDPVANVRAAVLKQLGEQPRPEIVSSVVAYIATEKDTDLIVHAVRVLRAAKTLPAVNCLLGLLSHESWRVRAEAIDSLADICLSREDGVAVEFPKERAAAAVTKLFADPDGFVAGRALAALKALAGGPSFEEMDVAIKHHPDLVFDVVKLLGTESADGQARQRLQKFCSDPKPAVRAAAIANLAKAAPQDCAAQVKAALLDKDGDVQTAGAEALYTVLKTELPQNGMIRKTTLIGGIQNPNEKVDPTDWLEKFRAGTGRPAWQGECIPALQSLLKSSSQPQRLAAAVALVALGHDDQALPVVLAAAQADASTRALASELLPWLPWEKRLAWFKTLSALQPEGTGIAELAEQLALMPDARATEVLWGLLGGKNGEAAIAPAFEALKTLYINDRFSSAGVPAEEIAKTFKATAEAQLEHGTDPQRLVALSLMLHSSAEDAADRAKKVLDSPKTSASLRIDAFQILLLAQPTADAQQTAAAALASESERAIRRLALLDLASGATAIQYVHGTFWIGYYNNATEAFRSNNSHEPIVIKPPEGLKAEVLEPLLKSEDPLDAASAGYLLCLLGKKEGLPPLIAYWRSEQSGRWNNSNQLVYRAIATLDDDSQTPILEEIYKSYNKNQYEVKPFYWTIRVMHGPNILKLRKTIRDEMGMQQLE